MPPHSEQIVSRICGALFRGSLTCPPPCAARAVHLRASACAVAVRSLPATDVEFAFLQFRLVAHGGLVSRSDRQAV
ncbi:hypothetical protein EBA01_13905 [Xanthomonas oryzae pv. oryzae]|nr:hypothetical protein C0L89_13900 [Xanthomonas oryzae pv. oryzae]AVU03330.1 hypothetical protein C0L90_14120 [Xanthomonas oryzae pv. oryzae]QBI12893.1 hypothetical protein EYR02_13960 [Xanthomonas oryzae pv. oryzae]QBI16544.1 hypothetical protein EYR03_14400 [Xanthomonas oryzae pv. oryzae]QBN24567.1 hypothetical protein EBA00_08465 [Xanthomonas oryzae pv. oryzae]